MELTFSGGCACDNVITDQGVSNQRYIEGPNIGMNFPRVSHGCCPLGGIYEFRGPSSPSLPAFPE